MTNRELLYLMKHNAIGHPTWAILKELVEREVQRMNPHADLDPCVYDDPQAESACFYGSVGCTSSHAWSRR